MLRIYTLDASSSFRHSRCLLAYVDCLRWYARHAGHTGHAGWLSVVDILVFQTGKRGRTCKDKTRSGWRKHESIQGTYLFQWRRSRSDSSHPHIVAPCPCPLPTFDFPGCLFSSEKKFREGWLTHDWTESSTTDKNLRRGGHVIA